MPKLNLFLAAPFPVAESGSARFAPASADPRTIYIDKFAIIRQLSLASRMLGVLLSLAGGALMGQAQGVMTLATESNSLIVSIGGNFPGVGAFVADYMGALIQQQLTPDYGSFWAFGIILVCIGMLIIIRGDKKLRDPKESEPLFDEPISM